MAKGRILIHLYSDDDLQRILDLLGTTGRMKEVSALLGCRQARKGWNV